MEKNWKRITVGTLDIASAGFALLLFFLVVMSISSLRQPMPYLRNYIALVAAFLAIEGLLALGGGVSALLRRSHLLTLCGSISASIALPLLGIPATVLVLLSPEVSRGRRIVFFIVLSPIWLASLALSVLVLAG